MRRRWSCLLLVTVALSAPAAPVWAQTEVLQIIPDDALGFAVVNRVGQTSDKLTNLAKRLKIDLPDNPLEKAKEALGVKKGIAENATGAVAVFAGKAENEHPRPLIFVPVENYQTFIEQLEPGEPAAAITTIKFQVGEGGLAAKRGNFAILAGPQDRELLERALKTNKSLSAWAEPLKGWLAENDASAVITGHGIKLLGAHARRGIDEAKQNLANLPPEAQMVGKFFDAAENFFKSVESDVTHAGLGARLDPKGNLHITSQARFLAGSGFAKAGASVKAPPGGPLAGLPSGPFVFAAGGAVPEKAMQGIIGMNLEMIKASGQNVPPETLKKLEDIYGRMMKGMNNMSLAWQVGKENQPMFAGLAMAMQTDNAAAYLAEYEKTIAVANEIFKELNLPFLPVYEVKKTKVDGKAALEMSMDFAGGLGLPQEAEQMFKNMFGPDGKMTIAVAARDDKTVVMRYTKAEGLKDLLNSQDRGLAGDPGVAEVSAALPRGAQWAFYISPKGATDFADRTVKTLLPIPLEIPSFAATPPIGVGVRISAESFEVHTVVPAAVLDNVGGFVDQLKKLFGGAI